MSQSPFSPPSPPPSSYAPVEPMPADTLTYATAAPTFADEEHLRLLAIFHWIVGPIQLLLGCFPIIHLIMGIAILNGAFPPANQGNGHSGPPFPPEFGWIFIIMALVFILIGWTFGVLTLISGFSIKARRRRLFSIIVAGLNCIHFPFGTALGVFTLIVLLRRSVETLYRSTAR